MTITTVPQGKSLVRLMRLRPLALGFEVEQEDGSPLDLAGSELRLVIADTARKGGDAKVTAMATMVNTDAGLARFDVQAADLAMPRGTYDMSVTLISTENYQSTVFVGEVEIEHNPDLGTVPAYDPVALPPTSLTARLLKQNNVQVRVRHVPDAQLQAATAVAEASREGAIEAKLAAELAQNAAGDSQVAAAASAVVAATAASSASGSAAAAQADAAAAAASNVQAGTNANQAGTYADEAADSAAYAASLVSNVVGYDDHGSVSGVLELDPNVGTHVLDATGPLTISVAAGGLGLPFTIMIRSGGADVTWSSEVGFDTGVPTVDLYTVTLIKVRGFWVAAGGSSGGGAGPVEPVLEAPTQPGAITVTPTDDGYGLAWVASTVALGYEVEIDGGVWVDSGADLAHNYTGLTAGSSHSGSVRAYNSLGERSAARTWGPASTNTVGLHEQIMALNPEIYLRMTEGSIQDYSRTSVAWAAASGKTLPAFGGPALTPGDTGTAEFIPGSQIERTASDLMNGATSLTLISVGASRPSPAVTSACEGVFYGTTRLSGGYSGGEPYDVHQPGGVHTWFSTWDPATQTESPPNFYRWIDGSSSRHSIVGGPGSGALGASDTGMLQIHGSIHGGSESEGGYTSYIAVLKNVVLTEEQRISIATAAGTLGNPAGGTLT